MKEWRGLWFPDSETHLQSDITAAKAPLVAGKPTYQLRKYTTVRALCRQRRRAVDIGANVGMWSRLMVLDFACVDAYEPVPEYCECFVRNVTGAVLHRVALGKEPGLCSMVCYRPGSCGDTRPSVDSDDPAAVSVVATKVPMRALDSYGFTDIDLLKIDCEGYELPVLEGARETLLRCRPAVVVEQKTGKAQVFSLPETGALPFLRSLGAHPSGVIGGDYFFAW